MKLVFTPSPNYIHKVIAVAHESGVLDRIELERCVPFEEGTEIWRYNPLGKVPTLVLDTGESLYGGLIVCEYLDSLSTGRRLFPGDGTRWQAMRQMALGDGLFDATTILRVESYRPEAERRPKTILRERTKVLGALDQLEKDAKGWSSRNFHIGQVCAAGGVSWVAWKTPINTLNAVPGDEDFDWRQRCPRLAAWFDEAVQRPSLAYKIDPAKVKGSKVEAAAAAAQT